MTVRCFFVQYLNAFLCGGVLCAVGQVLLDRTKLTPARILVCYVTAGVLLGGLGLCGQPFCCSQFLKNFQPVSIKMAKEQGLSLNPAKISGSCGRLMCCLAYEQKSYEYLNSITPQVGSIVRTPDGEGTVIEVNVVAGTLKVRSNVEILAPRIYKRDECVYVRGGKRTPLPADKEDK